MKNSGPTKVVFAAMAANFAIALTKIGASFYTGSSAMFTEAIHSFVDTGDQVLLLYGLRRARRPADEAHPFGHGLELYFWSFVVALLIFALGGVYAVYEGVEKLRNPEPMVGAWINLAVIGAAFLFEGYSFRLAWRELRQQGSKGGLWGALRRSKDPSTFIVFLEDGAALVGLVIALAGVVGTVWLSWPHADGVASIGIGLLLIGVAAILARETRSLLTGESASHSTMRAVRDIIQRQDGVERILELRSLQLGSDNILLTTTVKMKRNVTADRELRTLAEIRDLVRKNLPGGSHVYVTSGGATTDQ